ncbi:MAG TPA: zinc metalloprotease HtpX, partial [Cyanophyceae cyanobacterium]
MASVPNPSLDTGLAALKQGNYADAIAHLEGVRDFELDTSLVTRASQALVTAYQKNGDVENAIALCQELTHHPDPKIREWACGTLDKLPAPRQLPNTEQPFDGQSATPADGTGFVPLNPTASPSQKSRQGKPSTLKQRLAGLTNRLSSTSKGTASTQAPPSNSESSLDNNVQLPVPYSPPPTPHPSLFTPRPRWRNSGRAQNWSPLKPPKLLRLWLIQLASAIAFFWLLHFSVQWILQTTNLILVKLPLLEPIQLFYRDPTPAIGILALILLIFSPWLMDVLLKRFYQLEALPLTQLTSRNPEAGRVVQRLCRQKRIPVPTLGVLPMDAPVALTYGNLPRTARIVVSEGLLAQLSEEEIATIYAEQLGHIINRDFVLMSLAVLFLQIPYVIYWQVAEWGEWISELSEQKLPAYRKFLPPILLGIMGVIASVSYGFYWLLRLPLLWFSRARLYYSDRLAVETTGNPNGLTRALLKIGLGISEEIQTERQTNGLLERFELVLPLGYRQALKLGSCSPQIPFEAVLNWDCTNPYRDWLIISSSHPLLGERLHLLARYAQFWKLDTELDLPALASSPRSFPAWVEKVRDSYKALPLLQSAVLFGLILGTALRAILWLIGQISDRLNIWQLIWLHNATPFLNGCIAIAFSLSVIIWINSYFPDIKPATVQNDPNFGDFFTNPAILPPDSQPVRLTGQLLGRRGLRNWLGQDLILQTSTGLVKLHFFSFLGPFGNILPQPKHPNDLVGEQVTVTGWFRRGVTPWLDV